MFPRRYDLLAAILLDEVGGLHSDDIEGSTADEKRSLLIQRTADRWRSATASRSKAAPWKSASPP